LLGTIHEDKSFKKKGKRHNHNTKEVNGILRGTQRSVAVEGNMTSLVEKINATKLD
jgi:hypothetical protein